MKFLVILSIILCSAYATYRFDDCGESLESIITVKSVTISPDPIRINRDLEFALNGDLSAIITGGWLRVELLWKDELILDVATINLCDISSGITCPLVGPTFDFAEVVDVPEMPEGDYTLRISILSTNRNNLYGCVTIFAQVESEYETTSCEYTSEYNVALKGKQHNEIADFRNRGVGDWIQVGPVGDFAPLIVGIQFAFGTFEDLQGTEDLISTNPPDEEGLSKYVWGFSAEMVQKAKGEKGSELHRYEGTFFVGYDPKTPGAVKWVTEDRALATGTIDITFSYDLQSGFVLPVSNTYGVVTFDPKSTQPPGWRWPFMFGKLGPSFILEGADEQLRINGTRTFCSCDIDACGNCGPTENICEVAVANQPADSSSLNDIVVPLFVLVVVIIVLLVLLLLVAMWRRKHGIADVEIRPPKPRVRDDEYYRRLPAPRREYSDTSSSEDLLPPPDEDIGTFDSKNKPNYGLMALDDVLRENEA